MAGSLGRAIGESRRGCACLPCDGEVVFTGGDELELEGPEPVEVRSRKGPARPWYRAAGPSLRCTCALPCACHPSECPRLLRRWAQCLLTADLGKHTLTVRDDLPS